MGAGFGIPVFGAGRLKIVSLALDDLWVALRTSSVTDAVGSCFWRAAA
jgi:hypothetical protein